MTKKEKWTILGVFAFFLFLLFQMGGETITFYYMRSEPLSNNWLWGLALLFFLVGLRGIRKGMHVDGITTWGTRFTAFLDQGSHAGTSGIVGGVSFSLAFISAFIIAALMTHEQATFSSLYAIGIGLILIIPIFLILLFLLNSRKKISWGICIAWLITLLVLAKS